MKKAIGNGLKKNIPQLFLFTSNKSFNRHLINGKICICGQKN